MKQARPVLFLLCLLMGWLVPIVVMAQERIEYSDTEDVVIAFYKTAGQQPDFKRWIWEREPFKITPLARRERVYEEEKNRLYQDYINFLPTRDFLTIRNKVRLKPTEETAEDGTKSYRLGAYFASDLQPLYLPYEFLGQNFAVFPHLMDKIMNAPLSATEYQTVKSVEDSAFAGNFMILTLRPREADLSRPYDIDGLSQWVFKTDIATAEIWTDRGKFVWGYTAPWYISPTQKGITELYKERGS